MENYEQKSVKMLEKSTKINKKLKNMLNEIESKTKVDETKILEWSSEDVIR